MRFRDDVVVPSLPRQRQVWATTLLRAGGGQEGVAWRLLRWPNQLSRKETGRENSAVQCRNHKRGSGESCVRIAQAFTFGANIRLGGTRWTFTVTRQSCASRSMADSTTELSFKIVSVMIISRAAGFSSCALLRESVCSMPRVSPDRFGRCASSGQGATRSQPPPDLPRQVAFSLLTVCGAGGGSGGSCSCSCSPPATSLL
jgi:hypothetical protein